MDKHRRYVSFEVGDQFLLDSRHLSLPESLKFRVRFIGPFTTVLQLGPVAYRLEFLLRFSRVHLVFYVSLLRCYTAGGDGTAPPEPNIGTFGKMHFEVSRILGHRQRYGRLQYLTRFTGYDPNCDEWLYIEQLEDVEEKLMNYSEASKLTEQQE